MSKKSYTMSSRNAADTTSHAGFIGPKLGNTVVNDRPNRNLSPEQFHTGTNWQQQRLL